MLENKIEGSFRSALEMHSIKIRKNLSQNAHDLYSSYLVSKLEHRRGQDNEENEFDSFEH